MASVHARQNKDGTVSWRVLYRVGTRQLQETFSPSISDPKGERAEKAARDFARLAERVGGDAARKVRRARDGNAGANATPTLREWTAIYLDPTKGHLGGVTPGTRDGYERLAERSFLALLGDLPLDAISKQEVARWVHWQEQQPSSARPGQPVAAKTVKNYHALLSAVLAAAVEAGFVPANAARGARLSRSITPEMTILTERELSRLVELMPEHYRPLTLFLAGTGMRWGEATALTWGDLNLQGRVPTARVTKAWKRGPGGNPVLGPPKTRKAVRTVSLWPQLVAQLGQPGPADQLVFRGRGKGDQEGRRIWSERFHKSAWDPAVRKANEGDRPMGKWPRVHDLRHTHASWLIAAGAPLPYIQARLGHEKITTTVDTYGHLVPEAHEQMAVMAADSMRTVLAEDFRAIEAPTIDELEPGDPVDATDDEDAA